MVDKNNYNFLIFIVVIFVLIAFLISIYGKTDDNPGDDSSGKHHPGKRPKMSENCGTEPFGYQDGKISRCIEGTPHCNSTINGISTCSPPRFSQDGKNCDRETYDCTYNLVGQLDGSISADSILKTITTKTISYKGEEGLAAATSECDKTNHCVGVVISPVDNDDPYQTDGYNAILLAKNIDSSVITNNKNVKYERSKSIFLKGGKIPFLNDRVVLYYGTPKGLYWIKPESEGKHWKSRVLFKGTQGSNAHKLSFTPTDYINDAGYHIVYSKNKFNYGHAVDWINGTTVVPNSVLIVNPEQHKVPTLTSVLGYVMIIELMVPLSNTTEVEPEVKPVVKPLVKQVAKQAVKQAVKKEVKQVAKQAVKQVAKQVVKPENKNESSEDCSVEINQSNNPINSSITREYYTKTQKTFDNTSQSEIISESVKTMNSPEKTETGKENTMYKSDWTM